MNRMDLTTGEDAFVTQATDGDISDPVGMARDAGFDVATWFEYGRFDGVDFTGSDTAGVSFYLADLSGAVMTAEQCALAQASGAINLPPISETLDELVLYELASRLVEEVRTSGNKKLKFDHKRFKNLTKLPQNISTLHDLWSLDISGTKIDNISDLENMRSIRYLKLGKCPIKNIDILEKLFHLETLDFRHTQITNIQAIKKLKKIRRLNLEGCKVKELSALEKLPKLTHLYLSNTLVEDIAPIANIPSLTHIYMDGTLAKDISCLGKLTLLEWLDIRRTSVSKNFTPFKDSTKLVIQY